MTRKQERNIIASVGTVLFMGLVLLLLWLLHMTVTKTEKQDYIEVTFEPLEEIEQEIQKVVPKTQAPSVADPGTAAPSHSEPADLPTQQSAEQVVSDEDQLLAIQQAKDDSIAEANERAKKKAENLIGGFNFTDVEDNGTSSDKKDENSKGKAPKGEGSDGVNNWKLAGRGLVGTLPKPSNTFNQEGSVVVQIEVDANGNVTNASIAGGDISDKATTQLAIDAAKKAKFTSDKSIKQVGTITYYFKFN